MKLPSWISKEKVVLRDLHKIKSALREKSLHTVCEEAMCPNRGECFKKGTATFLLLGNICTRNCRFCSVPKGKPLPVDEKEPENIAKFVFENKIKYAVLTMVNRDDLPDGGAYHIKKTVEEIKKLNPSVKVEVLVGDFKGNLRDIDTVLEANIDVFNHNIEMVKRLFPKIRPKADYKTSLKILNYVFKNYSIPVKSGFMVGLGESKEEIIDLMKDLKANGVSILTIGQYLRPSMKNAEVKKYYTPEEFKEFEEIGLNLGFDFVFSSPFVRSSYMAEKVFEGLKK
ncbi:lipoyl synthase [Thermotomaculum hydrothermale]|uniref:Lipoyl synthase n=1 Tax=Thermotomaculum hydrothermale TaxID=981385 RepID=A0A7R6PPP9_9BACT|nr:lipoyl synthase [Thermotomaculum hydrothermale]